MYFLLQSSNYLFKFYLHFSKAYAAFYWTVNASYISNYIPEIG